MYDNAIGQQYSRAKRARPESLVVPVVVGLPIVSICNKTHHKENIASINHLYALWTYLVSIKETSNLASDSKTNHNINKTNLP